MNEDTWKTTGPRWYASCIDAARRKTKDPGCIDDSGRLPRPPSELERLLWPDPTDAEAPWITELGWTIVPPGSDPQDMHADIVASRPDEPGVSTARQRGRGRFHHVAWKSDHVR